MPRYQTPEMKAMQDSLRNLVATALKAEWTEISGRINTVFFTPGVRTRDGIVAWADVRCRPGWKSEYGNVFVGVDTWKEIQAASIRRTQPIYVVFSLPPPTGDVWCRYQPALDNHVFTKTGGRLDRGDPEDVGKMAFIPIRFFAPVGKESPAINPPQQRIAGF